jgi:hypothetical protein
MAVTLPSSFRLTRDRSNPQVGTLHVFVNFPSELVTGSALTPQDDAGGYLVSLNVNDVDDDPAWTSFYNSLKSTSENAIFVVLSDGSVVPLYETVNSPFSWDDTKFKLDIQILPTQVHDDHHIELRFAFVSAIESGVADFLDQQTSTSIQIGVDSFSPFASGRTILCDKGTYADGDLGAYTCVDTPAGTYVDTVAAAAPRDCPAGYVTAVAGSTVCTPCPLGRFAGEDGMSLCEPCEAGTYAAETGLSACEPCPAGTYASLTGAVACTPCPTDTTTGAEGATSADACVYSLASSEPPAPPPAPPSKPNIALTLAVLAAAVLMAILLLRLR